MASWTENKAEGKRRRTNAWKALALAFGLYLAVVLALALSDTARAQEGGGDGGFNFYCRPEINGLTAQLHPPAPYEQCSYHSHYNTRSQWTSNYGWEFGCGLSYSPCWTWEYV